MMSGLVKNYKRERFGSELWVKGQPSIDHDDQPILKLQRLGIDDCEIQLEFECQIGECLPKIVQERFQ